MTDKINPSHYKGLFEYKTFEVIDLTQYLDFVDGNMAKYVLRAGEKDGESWQDDLRKAEWYLCQAKTARREEPNEEAMAVFDKISVPDINDVIKWRKFMFVFWLLRKNYKDVENELTLLRNALLAKEKQK